MSPHRPLEPCLVAVPGAELESVDRRVHSFSGSCQKPVTFGSLVPDAKVFPITWTSHHKPLEDRRRARSRHKAHADCLLQMFS